MRIPRTEMKLRKIDIGNDQLDNTIEIINAKESIQHLYAICN